ncbi:MAG TPA: hypothetical protein VET88_15550 [Gammaproteobacteria bacterium]|nr:hypothetical protein [Gammaproteobacteria bacterium]
MKHRIECWHCGTAVKPDQLPVTRLEQCRHCHADLHACRLCRYWNPRYTSKCSHDHAEPPLERESANFCQFFRPVAGAFRNAAAPPGEAARASLESLFGVPHEESGNDTAVDDMTESERARRALEDLFGNDKGDESPGCG